MGARMNPPDGTTELPDIKEIAGPDTLPDIWELLGSAGGVVIGLGILTALLVLLYRRLSSRKAVALSPLARVQRRLDALSRDVDSLSANAFSVAVSDALKDYLSQRYGDPLRYETSEEFLQRLSRAGANALPMATRESVTAFLSVADEIKYGRPRDAEARKLPLLDQAREVIREPSGTPPPQSGNPQAGRRRLPPPKA